MLGEYDLLGLDASKANMVYVPSGLAHGFCVIGESAILLNRTSSMYSPEHDSGILWNSLSIPWPIKTPLLSVRDKKLVPLSRFVSPFRFKV